MKLIFLFALAAAVCFAQTEPSPPAIGLPPVSEDESPIQYNIDLPTGENQPQPIYFTKDLTFNIGSTQIGFYGFIKFDYLGQTRIAGNAGDVLLRAVPLNSELRSRRTESILDARSSRLGIKIEDSIDGVLMKGAVEGDFFNSFGDSIHSNSRLFRIRLAYATAETTSHFFFLVGQYYTIPMHYPEIDMPTRVNITHFPAGVVNSRQPQARLGYKQYVSKTRLMQYEIGAETQGYNTVGAVLPFDATTAQAAMQKWPLFCAKASWLSDSLRIDVAGAATKAYAIVNQEGARLNTPVWGVISNASYNWKNLTLFGTLHHWVGLTGLSSGYFNQWALTQNSAKLEAVKANGGCAAVRYDFLKSKLWMDAMYGVERCSEIEGTELFDGRALKKIEDFRINLVGAFWKHWQIGAEYERTYVQSYDLQTGVDNMFHIAVWYVFGQP